MTLKRKSVPKIPGCTDSFGRNLREVREGLEMTLTELADHAGLTPACLSQVENGTRCPTLPTIVRILSVLPVKFERILGFDPFAQRRRQDVEDSWR